MSFLLAKAIRYENRTIPQTGEQYIFIAGLIYDDTWLRLDYQGNPIIITPEQAATSNEVLNSSNQILQPAHVEYRIEGAEFSALPPSGNPPSPTDARGQAIFSLLQTKATADYLNLAQKRSSIQMSLPMPSDQLNVFPILTPNMVT